MKPKNKFQQYVYSLFEKLPPISKKQDEWLLHVINKYYALKTKHTATCFECGHQWKVETNLMSKLELECPQCGKNLITSDKKAWCRKDVDYCSITTTHNEFQVLRYFHVERNCRKGKPANYWYHEVFQHWISPQGKNVIISVDCSTFYNSYYHDHPLWRFYSNMEIRNDNNRYYCKSKIYPYKKWIPELKRNGFNNSFFNYSEPYFIKTLLSNSMFETLLKSKQYPLLQKFYNYENRIKDYWPSIRICIRNNYLVKDAVMWLDHLRLLEYFSLDLLSPKYVCPNDLHKEHQRLIKKREELERKKELAELKAKIYESNVIFQKKKKKFFDIEFGNKNIKIVPLKSVQEFYDEGKALKHCLFQGKYYEDDDSLILSARKQDEILETIEVDLKGLRVNQAYGIYNKPTSYHKVIVSLVNKNMPLIKSKLKSKKKVA